MDQDSLDALRARAREALDRLKGFGGDEDLREAKVLVERLRNCRDYELMGQLAEAVSRRDPKDARNRRLYAQYLIETGKATAAIDLLLPLARRLAKTDPELAEATGLIGRAYKQIFFDAGDKTSTGAREALKKAIETYRGPYEQDRRMTWHGVNLLALVTRARGLGLRVAPDLDPRRLAEEVMATLAAVPEGERDEWYLPTLAEASLGLRDWDTIERHVSRYVNAPGVQAFHVASTLRQFKEVWDLEHGDPRGNALLVMLCARLMQLPGGEMRLTPRELQRIGNYPAPSAGQLEAVLGANGPKTFQWWKTALDRAAAVGAVKQRMGTRFGTAFLVRAGDLGLEPSDELLALTNFHVVNEHGANNGLTPADAEVVFEALDAGTPHAIAQILWSSPPEKHDASLLRLDPPVAAAAPVPIARGLPLVDDSARVYIIGHPGGRDLSFSFQDNELLDHEGAPQGKPAIAGVCRLHYRAPTEGGSSGSPVFNAQLWQVIALHHSGGKIGVPRLNGKDGTYAANEGISIQSIIEAMKG